MVGVSELLGPARGLGRGSLRGLAGFPTQSAAAHTHTGQEWHKKEEEVQNAKQIVQRCEQITQNVRMQIEARAALDQTAEQQASDEDILAEALAADQQAKDNLMEAQEEANALETTANELAESAQGAADRADQAMLDPEQLDGFLEEFGEQDDQQ